SLAGSQVMNSGVMTSPHSFSTTSYPISPTPSILAHPHHPQPRQSKLTVNHLRHLIQLLRANIRTMREPKVHQLKPSLQLLLRILIPVLVDQLKRTPETRLPDRFRLIPDPLPLYTLLFVAEVAD